MAITGCLRQIKTFIKVGNSLMHLTCYYRPLPAWSPCAYSAISFTWSRKTGTRHTISQRSLGDLVWGQAVSWGGSCSVFFLCSGQLCRAHTNCWCISACISCIPFWTQEFINSYSPLVGAASRLMVRTHQQRPYKLCMHDAWNLVTCLCGFYLLYMSEQKKKNTKIDADNVLVRRSSCLLVYWTQLARDA
jgi:hypothetical protein